MQISPRIDFAGGCLPAAGRPARLHRSMRMVVLTEVSPRLHEVFMRIGRGIGATPRGAPPRRPARPLAGQAPMHPLARGGWPGEGLRKEAVFRARDAGFHS
mgnify:CR=1 FL=1